MKRALLIAASIAATALPAAARWPAARAAAWHARQPLPIGFNYVPANAISYTEMWMADGFMADRIGRELALAGDVGFNCLRVVLSFVVWEAEPAAMEQRFGQFLKLCHSHGLRVMPCFFDDCVFGPVRDPVFGRQPELVEGWYANAWTPSPGHQRVRDPRVRPALARYVKSIMTRHRSDPRILCWDLYNEPGNSGMGEDSLPLLRDAFAWAREVDPAQPVTSGVWGPANGIRAFLLEEPDVITFHCYQPADELRRQIRELGRLGRPVICTEWLHRPQRSLVGDCLPVFLEERVGALHWGLVNGRTQTHLPWGHRPGKPYAGPWQHDLFRPDGTPYDPREVDLFKAAIRAAAQAQPPQPAAPSP